MSLRPGSGLASSRSHAEGCRIFGHHAVGELPFTTQGSALPSRADQLRGAVVQDRDGYVERRAPLRRFATMADMSSSASAAKCAMFML